MNCALCRPLLSKYVDGEATPAERAQVEAHLGGCPACSALLSRYRVLSSRVAALPDYRPDPRLRSRLFAAIAAAERAPEEVPITRRGPATAIRPARPAPRRRGLLFGNLASAFGVLVVLVALLVVSQMVGGGPSVALATPLPTHDTAAQQPLPVPTKIAGLLPLPQVTAAVALAATAPGGRMASPTATFWSPAEDGAATHTVRDENYGYALQYPAGWWTASAVPALGLLAHRILRPWGRTDMDLPPVSLAVDVLDNPTGVQAQDALAHPALLAAWDEPVAGVTAVATAIAGLRGLTAGSESGGRRRQATYLFAGPLVYRLVVQTVPRPVPSSGLADGADSAAGAEQVVRSFRPPAGARRPGGYAPVLFLQDGDLWQADPAGGLPQALTTGGLVRGFALAPDLAQVALILAARPADRWGRQIAVRRLDGTGARLVWQAGEIHSVAWYGDTDLMAIGGTPGGAPPLGLYRLSLAGGTVQALAGFNLLPDHGAGADEVQVSPDRLWISYRAAGRAGPVLYGVHADGLGRRLLLPNVVARPVVSAYAWLPPADGDADSRILILDGTRLDEVTLVPGQAEPALAPLSLGNNARIDEFAVAAAGAVAAVGHPAGGPGALYLCKDLAAPGGPHWQALPAGSPAAGWMALSADGRYVFYGSGAAKGGTAPVMVDTAANGAGRPAPAGPPAVP